MTTSIAKNVWQPGEKGSIKVSVKFEGMTGLLNRSILVHIDGRNEPVVLKLSITIPQEVTILPQVLIWDVGEKPAAKTARIKVDPASNIRFVGVTSTNGHISAKLRADPADPSGRTYNLVITPDQTSSAYSGTLKLETSPASDKAFVAYAWVAPISRNPDR